MWRFLRRWTTCWFYHSYAPQIVWGTDQWGCQDFELEDFCWYCGRPRVEDVKLAKDNDGFRD